MKKLTRRTFLSATGLSAGGLMIGAELYVKEKYFSEPVPDSIPENSHRLDLFVQISPSGKIYIVSHRSEMGQGISSSLPRVIADEMEAAWEDIEIVQAPGHSDYGDQNTDGSQSVRKNFKRLRKVGATVRKILENTAAEIWKVPADECAAKQSKVICNDGRSLSFADLAEAASKQPLPVSEKIKLKSRDEFRYIGKDSNTINNFEIVTGNTTYAWDVQLPNMEYACVKRCPVVGGDVKTLLNEEEIRSLPGVLDVIIIQATPLPVRFHALAGVAVVAANTWSAFNACKKIQVEWGYNGAAEKNQRHTSKEYIKELQRSLERESEIVRKRGDVAKVFSTSVEQLTATYTIPYLSHAPMETPCAVAQVSLAEATIWACTQHPQGVQAEVANALGTHSRMVKVNVTLLGGAFGRKSMSDFCVEAALLSKARKGKPVKVCWTREDDIQHDYYHAISVTSFHAAIDKDKNITAMEAKATFPGIGSTWDAESKGPSKGEMSGLALLPFDIPNIDISMGKATTHTRVGWLRSVINIEHAFGVGSFIDELARKLNKPTQHLWLDLIPQNTYLDFGAEGVDSFKGKAVEDDYPYNTERYRNIIKKVSIHISEENIQPDQGWGFAAHFSFLSYAAVASKVTLKKNKLTIDEVVIGLDCGEIVNPDRVRAQLEGAVIFGLSLALYGEISMKNGAVEQSNFHDYKMLRINQCPKITTILIPGDNAPSGVGEPGVPPVAASICNAIVAAGGIRIRDLPIKNHLTSESSD